MLIHLVSGFLGSGKTTAIAALASQYLSEGKRVAVVTNDQGVALVDTSWLRSTGVRVSEVRGGCFCCRYQEFDEVLAFLRKDGPFDIVLAEAVGSCTDLVATVVKPLIADTKNGVTLVTSTVFVDASLLWFRLAGIPLPFSDSVQYIFERQLEEAGILIVNKSDLLSPENAHEAVERMRILIPARTVLLQNSHDASQIARWGKALNDFSGAVLNSNQVDYKLYGSGEAQLAWMDAAVEVHGSGELRTGLVDAFQQAMSRILSTEKIPVGHVKVFWTTKSGTWKASLTTNQDWSADPVERVLNAPEAFLFNARWECSAETALRVFGEVLSEVRGLGAVLSVVRQDAFHPGFPTPIHRLS